MRPETMNSSTISRSAIFVVIIMFNFYILTTAAPIQELPPRKGHVPVYIRTGDEPLDQIHPGLAEAFKESNEGQLKAENLVIEAPKTEESSIVEASNEKPNGDVQGDLPATEELPANSTTESDIVSFEHFKSIGGKK
ncbi:uncharacterized protein LOC115628248 [Scaptodrosophila lebanonensis]|uniref:Uncharacterized protein LOC115628248 n=1 Tax=Drosophila lebanonensis TaxID=7225 RepID=A0A6J2TYA0_DROLE|nr:uncharacterized protein LOC115628248 [Scaptodrosophila lebanonensis]